MQKEDLIDLIRIKQPSYSHITDGTFDDYGQFVGDIFHWNYYKLEKLEESELLKIRKLL
jgi:hypothetical protein